MKAKPSIEGLTLTLVPSATVDRDAAARLINAAFGIYSFLLEGRTSPEALSEEMGDSGELIAARLDGRMVGCAMIRPDRDVLHGFEPHVHEGDPSALYFGLAAVAVSLMRSGIGRRLVTKAEEEARRRGYAKVVLGTLEEMGNVTYYESLGYRSVAVQAFKPGHYGISIPHRLHEMEKAVAPFVPRVAGPADVPGITSLVNLAYRVEDFFIDGNRTTEAEVADLLASGCFLVLDAAPGQLAAAVHVAFEGPHGHFAMLSVDPAHQRGGLGRQLIAAAEALACEHACATMDLEVVNLREELPPWYRRLGYHETGTRPFPTPAKLKKEAHFVTMSKNLASKPLMTGAITHEDSRR